jgi:hypothetical protein
MLHIPKNSWQNKIRIDSQVYMFPVFKFGTVEHTKNLCEKGEVYIPTLHEFRDTEKYAGTIGDAEEGFFEIINEYSRYEGVAGAANGLLRVKAPANERVNLINVAFQECIQNTWTIVFCTAEYFFSESLSWAIEHGKNSCALIFDFEEFADIGSQALSPEYSYVDIGPCIYEGRTIREKDPGPNSRTEFFLRNATKQCFVKPRTHAKQNKVRAIWAVPFGGPGLPKPVSQPKKVEIPILRGYVMPINFGSISLGHLRNFKAGSGLLVLRL